MAKVKTKWVCQNCGYETVSYLGRCPDCGQFSTFTEEISQTKVEIKTNSPSNAVVAGGFGERKKNNKKNYEKKKKKKRKEEI